MIILPLYSSGCLEENSYIITDESTGLSAIIDPNFENVDMEKLLKEYNIDKILLTHGHFDHIMSAEALREKTGAKIYIHELDYPVALNPELNLSPMLGIGSGISLKTDVSLKDKEVVTLGKTQITVLHTPGHTIGSSCYIVGDNIFTGDMLFSGSVGRTDFPTGDYSQMEESVNKLKALTKDYTVYSGHGEKTTLYKEINSNPYF